jgi:hypothetical protein
MGVAYYVTGSVASMYFGEPRFTNDIDVVIDLPANRVTEFCRAFPDDMDFYVSEDAVREAVARRDQFNVLHATSGLKIDVMIPKRTPFDESRLARRVRVKPEPDYDAAFASPEDIILKKMDFYREGGSEKHLRDIAGILKVTGPRVDRTYIGQWARTLGLDDIWQAVQQRVPSPADQGPPSGGN